MPFDQGPAPRGIGAERDPILRTLLRARELLEHGWCQGAYARDADGHICKEHDGAAMSFCLAGATYRAATESSAKFSTYNGACLWLADAFNGDCISEYNDAHGRTKAEVLDVVDRAISSRRAHLAARECVS